MMICWSVFILYKYLYIIIIIIIFIIIRKQVWLFHSNCNFWMIILPVLIFY